jgi:hypothetical protein
MLQVGATRIEEEEEEEEEEDEYWSIYYEFVALTVV